MNRKGQGRKPLSDAEKTKKGTIRKDRINEGAPKAIKVEMIPAAPDWLGVDGAEHWARQVEYLHRMGILAKTDLGALSMLCKEWQNYVNAEKQMDQNARYYNVKDESGVVKYWGVHPAHTIAQQHLKAYISICGEFGFTPAARSRISLPSNENTKSKAAGLLKKAV